MLDLKTRVVTALATPGKGVVDQLQSSNDGKTYGFRFNDKDPNSTIGYHNVIFIHNTDPGFRMTPVYGISTNPLQALDWKFAPDGVSILARTYSTNVLLIDRNLKHAPVALGQFSDIGNFSSDGTKLSVRLTTGFGVFDIPNRRLTILTLDTMRVKGQSVEPLDIMQLANQEGEVSHVLTSDTAINTPTSEYLVVSGKQAVSVLRRYDRSQRILLAYRPTDNDQYIVTEEASILQSSNASYDGYPTLSQPLRTHSLFINAFNGTVKKDIDGTTVRWRH